MFLGYAQELDMEDAMEMMDGGEDLGDFMENEELEGDDAAGTDLGGAVGLVAGAAAAGIVADALGSKTAKKGKDGDDNAGMSFGAHVRVILMSPRLVHVHA